MKRTTTTVLLVLINLAGCGSTPVQDRYYSLVLDAADSGTVEVNNDAARRVLLASVGIPEFLESRSMAMQTGANQIQVAHHHFWAERLDEAIASVLVADISRDARDIRIEQDDDGAICTLRLEFDRFHASDDGRILVSGRYWLSTKAASNRTEFDLSQRLAGTGHASAVSALRGAVASLARQLADEIESTTLCSRSDAGE